MRVRRTAICELNSERVRGVGLDNVQCGAWCGEFRWWWFEIDGAGIRLVDFGWHWMAGLMSEVGSEVRRF